MGQLKVREVKGMIPAPEIFIIWLGRENMRFLHMCKCAFIYDPSREELQGIKKGRITAFMQAYLIYWIKS